MYSCLGHQGWIKIITTAPLCPPSLYQMSRHMTQTSQAFPSCLHTGIDQILEVAKTLQTHSCLLHNTLHSNSNLLSLLPRIEHCQCSCGYIQQHCIWCTGRTGMNYTTRKGVTEKGGWVHMQGDVWSWSYGSLLVCTNRLGGWIFGSI